MRGWPAATIAFYGPDAKRATKVAVGIVMGDEDEPLKMRDWSTATGDVRNNAAIATEMLGFIEKHGALSIIMTDRIIGCPHQTGIDYEGDWCPDPACAYWYERDSFTGESRSGNDHLRPLGARQLSDEHETIGSDVLASLAVVVSKRP